jgi:hypothetical protein
VSIDLAQPVREGPFSTRTTGEIAGSLTARQCPTVAGLSIPCKMVRFKAKAANAGNVYLGTSANVTALTGADNQTAGYQLASGEDTGWILAANVNAFWIICDNAGDGLTFMADNN